MRKMAWFVFGMAVITLAALYCVAKAESLRWTAATGWVNADNAAQTGTFTPVEMGTMTYYVRINKSNPKDVAGRTGFNQPGTWYYVGEARNGGLSWPADNALATLFQGYGWAGLPVSFTVTQAFKDSDGVERESVLSAIYPWTVPVPFVPKRPATAPAGLGIQ